MAVPNLPFNPAATTNAANSFSAQSVGYIQGVALDDPATRFALAGATLATTETLPMWGGIAIKEFIPASGNLLGGSVARATTNAEIKGFSVYNQNGATLTTPQSQAPVSLGGGAVHFFRLGSKARIAVAIDAVLAATLVNGTTLIDANVSWDLTNQKIITYDAGVGALAAKILDINIGNSKTVTYDAVNNLCNWTYTGSVAIIEI